MPQTNYKKIMQKHFFDLKFSTESDYTDIDGFANI